MKMKVARVLSLIQVSVLVMVEGPAVGKAGNFLDWIAGGLGMNELKDFGSPCPL